MSCLSIPTLASTKVQQYQIASLTPVGLIRRDRVGAPRCASQACGCYRPPRPYRPRDSHPAAIRPRALLRPLWRQGSPNVCLPIPIAAFRAQGSLGQLSARSGLLSNGQKTLAVGGTCW
jgi:hypothetical protein